MKHLKYNEDGSPEGFYDDAIHAELPARCVPISDKQWADHLDGTSRLSVNLSGDPVAVSHPPKTPSIEVLKRRAVGRALDRASLFTRAFTSGYSPEEVASWPVKAAAARAHTLAAPQPIIVEEAAITGETPEALAATIIAKADLYETIIARVTGLRRKIEDQIAAAATSEEIEAALEAAQITATEMATELGVSFPTTAT